MNVISNAEFVKLVENQTTRLRGFASQRLKANPAGAMTLGEIENLAETCKFMGDAKSSGWLQSLSVMARSGKLARLRRNAHTYQDHVEEIHLLKRTGAIQFDLHDHVVCKETGRYGSVVDYIPDTKEFVVILDPFAIRTCKADQLEKVASIEE